VKEDAEKRANRREKNRLRQKIYRERQRTIIEKRKNDGENAAQREASPQSYIPAHQRNAIDEFFNRLRRRAARRTVTAYGRTFTAVFCVGPAIPVP
jgi:hypothetical protein